MKWVMHDKKTFTGEQDGYVISIKNGFYWYIFKDGFMVDCYAYHVPPPTLDELNAKVQAERCLNKLITSQTPQP